MPRLTVTALLCVLVSAQTIAHGQAVDKGGASEEHVAPHDVRFPEEWYSKASGTDVAAPVKGLPYVASVVSPTPKNSVVEKTSYTVDGLQARDREGRVRSESVNGATAVGDEMVKTKEVEVSDPVSHCRFHWMELVTSAEMPARFRTAFVSCSQRTARYQDTSLLNVLLESPEETKGLQADPGTKIEHLPTFEKDGIKIERLSVSSLRTDSQGHQSRWTRETWYSTQLKELLGFNDSDDGYSGLFDIRRTDPDPKLFYPPANYEIEVDPVRASEAPSR